jgi:hypothetical protein
VNEAFRHLHMPPELACDFLAVFSRMEYALKATDYVQGGEDRVSACWDRFANDIDNAFRSLKDDDFKAAVACSTEHPPRKQVLRNGSLTFVDQTIDPKQAIAQQTFLMIRTVRNNLFHGGKHTPDGEQEQHRNEMLVSSSLVVLKTCVSLNDKVSSCYER